MAIDVAMLTVGLLVEHPTLGLGKVIAVQQGYVYVYFLEASPPDEAKSFQVAFAAANLSRAELQQHEELDHLPEFRKVDGKFRIERKGRTFLEALETFRKFFPGGFEDPKYVQSERDYKVEASQELTNAFGSGRGLALLEEGRVKEVADRARALDTTNLVHPRWEKPRLAEALADPAAANAYFQAVFQIADAPDVTRALFDELSTAVNALKPENGTLSRWPAATIFPALLSPERFIFFRATPMVEAATMASVALVYRSEPNWQTYEAAMLLAKKLLVKLQPLGARDMLDVQSFVFVTWSGSGYNR